MNILLIVCDTMRVDHLRCYGYFRNTTPNIDRIAKDGVIFEDFYTAGSPTGPSFTCMYTGLHTIHHRFYRFSRPNERQVDDTIFTMPEILKTCGYTTAAFDNLINFPPHSKHWVRGYDFYINPSPEAFMFPPRLMAEHVNRRLIPWIKDHADEKFFLFVHYWDPHLPYNQPQKYEEIFRHKKGELSDLKVIEAPGYKYVPGWGKIGEFPDGEIKWRGRKLSIDLYDGEIAYMDNAIGEVIETLDDMNALDNTLIIITADHGEHLLQHRNYWGHNSLHDTVVHVPLVMRYPGKLPRGTRIKGFGQHIDLLPTILDIIEVSAENLKFDGKSLLPLLKGKTIRDTIFMEETRMQRAVRTEKWKLIEDYVMNSLELYDIRNDPLETINLAETERRKTEELKNALNSWIKESLKERGKDPMIYEDGGGLSRDTIKYREKIWRFHASLGKNWSWYG